MQFPLTNPITYKRMVFIGFRKIFPFGKDVNNIFQFLGVFSPFG